jgi:hypothetical protein
VTQPTPMDAALRRYRTAPFALRSGGGLALSGRF